MLFLLYQLNPDLLQSRLKNRGNIQQLRTWDHQSCKADYQAAFCLSLNPPYSGSEEFELFGLQAPTLLHAIRKSQKYLESFPSQSD